MTVREFKKRLFLINMVTSGMDVNDSPIKELKLDRNIELELEGGTA